MYPPPTTVAASSFKPDFLTKLTRQYLVLMALIFGLSATAQTETILTYYWNCKQRKKQ